MSAKVLDNGRLFGHTRALGLWSRWINFRNLVKAADSLSGPRPGVIMALAGARRFSSCSSLPTPGADNNLEVTPGVTCLFCRQDDRSANRVLCDNATFYARYDNFPATRGHVEVVPKRHVVSFFDLTDGEMADAYSLLKTARELLERDVHPDGYTIGINEGVAAGRSVHHLHIHLVPRRHGDVEDPRGGIRRALPNGNPELWGIEPDLRSAGSVSA